MDGSAAPRFRPTVVTTELGNGRVLEPGASFDLGICLTELAELPVGLAKSLLVEYRRRCRFLIVSLRLPKPRRESSADPTVWDKNDLSELAVLDRRGEHDTALSSCGEGVTSVATVRSHEFITSLPVARFVGVSRSFTTMSKF